MQTNANNLDAAIEQIHRSALSSILKGNPMLHVTPGNPFGPFARGSAPVAETMAGPPRTTGTEVATIELEAKGGRRQRIGTPIPSRRHRGPSP